MTPYTAAVNVDESLRRANAALFYIIKGSSRVGSVSNLQFTDSLLQALDH